MRCLRWKHGGQRPFQLRTFRTFWIAVEVQLPQVSTNQMACFSFDYRAGFVSVIFISHNEGQLCALFRCRIALCYGSFDREAGPARAPGIVAMDEHPDIFEQPQRWRVLVCLPREPVGERFVIEWERRSRVCKQGPNRDDRLENQRCKFKIRLVTWGSGGNRVCRRCAVKIDLRYQVCPACLKAIFIFAVSLQLDGYSLRAKMVLSCNWRREKPIVQFGTILYLYAAPRKASGQYPMRRPAVNKAACLASVWCCLFVRRVNWFWGDWAALL